MKIRQTYCKNCKHYFKGDCSILIDTMVKKEKPCGKIDYKFPLKSKLKKLGCKIFTKSWTVIAMEFSYRDSCKNFVDSCTLNKGNCKYYNPKWYRFFDKLGKKQNKKYEV